MSTISTLAGVVTPASYYISNHYYNNGEKATFHFPFALAVDPSGNVYVIEKDYPFIRKIDKNGITSEFAGSSEFNNGIYTGYGLVDGSLSDARFKVPRGMAFDKNAGYVADTYNGAIRKIVKGTVSTLITGLVSPNALCLDSTGNIWVADGNQVKKVSPDGVVIGVIGLQSPGNVNSNLTLSKFGLLEFIAFDEPNNCLYVSDTGYNTLKKIDLTAGRVSKVDVSCTENTIPYQLMIPSGLALGNGKLFVADRGGNIIFKIENGIVSRYAGNGLAKFKDGASTQDRLGASLYQPEGIALYANGDLGVTDLGNSRIRLVKP